MSEHTKGPWRVAVTSDGFISVGGETMHEMSGFIPTTFKNTIADVWREEDARLIAAAPELLEALKAARVYLNPTNRPAPEYVHDLIEAAIAKAVQL